MQEVEDEVTKIVSNSQTPSPFDVHYPTSIRNPGMSGGINICIHPLRDYVNTYRHV